MLPLALFFLISFNLFGEPTRALEEIESCKAKKQPAVCSGKVLAYEIVDFYKHLGETSNPNLKAPTCQIILYKSRNCHCINDRCELGDTHSALLEGPDYLDSCLNKFSGLISIIRSYDSQKIRSECFNNTYSELSTLCSFLHEKCKGDI